MAEFPPGLELSRSYYWEVVRPLLDARLPGLVHSAALLGQGSEVLGFDTVRSTDHDWGPRVQLFVATADSPADVESALWAALPDTYRGLPTRFETRRPPLVVTSPARFFVELLGFDPRLEIGLRDWLGASWQRLGEATAGAVFHDGLGELEPIRATLRWYPEDLWRYVLACQWQRIGQEEPFVGRCAEVGDALGAAVVAARLVRDVMHLSLLMARRYPPYSKWLGTAFARLDDAAGILEALTGALAARDHPTRERALCRAYELAAEWHNRLGLTAPVDPTVRHFHDRPFLVLDAGRFTTALLDSITDPEVRALPPVGAVDQYLDSTDVLSHTARTRAAASWSATRSFSVRCVFRCEDTYEERITLWLTSDAERAIALAEAEAAEYAETVGWEYLGLAQSYELSDRPGDGAEVFSLMRDSDLDPNAYLNTFFDTGREREQQWADGDLGQVWVVWRQDDNGNRFEVAQLTSRAAADELAHTMEARGHKQTYWVAAAT